MYDLGSDEKGRVKGMKSDGLLEFRGTPLEEVEERVLRDVVGGEEVLSMIPLYLSLHLSYLLLIMIFYLHIDIYIGKDRIANLVLCVQRWNTSLLTPTTGDKG